MGLLGVAACLSRRKSDGFESRTDRLWALGLHGVVTCLASRIVNRVQFPFPQLGTFGRKSHLLPIIPERGCQSRHAAFLLENNPDMYKLAKLAAMHAKEHEKYKTALEKKEPKEYDYEKGQDNTMHRVAVDISAGDSGTEITGISEVSVEGMSD